MYRHRSLFAYYVQCVSVFVWQCHESLGIRMSVPNEKASERACMRARARVAGRQAISNGRQPATKQHAIAIRQVSRMALLLDVGRMVSGGWWWVVMLRWLALYAAAVGQKKGAQGGRTTFYTRWAPSLPSYVKRDGRRNLRMEIRCATECVYLFLRVVHIEVDMAEYVYVLAYVCTMYTYELSEEVRGRKNGGG